MSLSKYHQKYADQGSDEIQKKVDAKEQELKEIFGEIPFNTKNDTVRLAVLGCGDKRFVTPHKRIFEKILQKNVEVTTFDISVEHLGGESNIIKHDCTQVLPNPPYDITYAHVLLKFIEPEKQFDLLKNSYDALKTGGIAIHIFDWDEIKSETLKLKDGLWKVPLDELKVKLSSIGIAYKTIVLKYGPALVLLQQ